MARDRSLHVGPLVSASALLLLSVAACGPNDSSADADSTPGAASSTDVPTTLAQPGTVNGEKAGKTSNGGVKDGNCDGYDVSGRNATFNFVIKESLSPAQVKEVADSVATLCFAVDANAVDKVFQVPETAPPIGVWIQPEMRMANSNPDAVPDNAGMVVAKVRNEKVDNSDAELPVWKRNGKKLGHRRDALVWYGKENGSRVAVVFEIQGNHINELARGSWKEEKVDPPHAIASARWNRPHAHLVTHNGAGWISCTLGCCTALDLMVEQ